MFTINRIWADPRFLDLSIDPSTRSAGCYAGDPRTANYSAYSLVPYITLRGWLSMWSLSDAQCRGTENFNKIKVPSLVLQSTGDRGVFPSDAQAVYDNLGASDRTLKFLPGEHFFESKGDSPEEAASFIAEWASERTGT